MSARDEHLSAFDLGQKAGADPTAPGSNPFEIGTDRHNNFEVGRRFGAKNSQTKQTYAHPTAWDRPDADETGFDEEA